MRRMIPVLAAVATLAVSTSAFAGHTAVEYVQWFGAPLVNPGAAPTGGGDFGAPGAVANPNVVLNLGDVAYFPIYGRILAGNGAVTLNSVGYEIYRSGDNVGGHSGAIGSVPFATVQNIQPLAGSGAAHPNDATKFQFQTQHFANKTGAASGIGIGDGVVFLGYTSLTASSAGTMDLWLSGNTDATRTYVFSVVTATLNSIAFGADAANVEGDGDGLNAFRAQNTALDVGTGAGHLSTLTDATITVVPEPTTIGLLGLGLLAIRRRRA